MIFWIVFVYSVCGRCWLLWVDCLLIGKMIFCFLFCFWWIVMWLWCNWIKIGLMIGLNDGLIWCWMGVYWMKLRLCYWYGIWCIYYLKLLVFLSWLFIWKVKWFLMWCVKKLLFLVDSMLKDSVFGFVLEWKSGIFIKYSVIEIFF